MRATIDSTGTLIIVPENEIEAYALRCYQEKFESGAAAICFGWDINLIRNLSPDPYCNVKNEH